MGEIFTWDKEWYYLQCALIIKIKNCSKNATFCNWLPFH